jgi:hypothetical protein
VIHSLYSLAHRDIEEHEISAPAEELESHDFILDAIYGIKVLSSSLKSKAVLIPLVNRIHSAKTLRRQSKIVRRPESL